MARIAPEAVFAPTHEMKFTGGALPPAALALAPAKHVSAKYQFIDTRQVVEMMTAEGFQVAEASTRRNRNAVTQTGVHMIDFRHPDAPKIAGVAPRVLFINSHDGSRKARAMVGAFRFVCSNGLITGTTLESVVAKHSGDAAAELVKRMRELSKNTLPMFKQIEQWSRISISTQRAEEFARLASILRWGTADMVPVESLLTVRRAGDDAGDLWSVFNRVQESTTKGGLEGRGASGRRTQTRELREVTVNARYNSALWQLAEEFAT